MAKGKVKWFNKEKGYGFLTEDVSGKEYFAHYSEIKMTGFKQLAEGQAVQFDTQASPKGERAVGITLL